MCHKLGLVNVMAAGTKEEFDAIIKQNIDDAMAMSFGGIPATPRVKIDAIIVDWETAEKGLVTFIKTFKQKYSGRFGFLVLCGEKHTEKFLLASKAGANAFLKKPFSMDQLKEKLTMVLLGKSEPIVQGFNLQGASTKSSKQGFGESPFSFQQAVDKKKPALSPAEAAQLESEAKKLAKGETVGKQRVMSAEDMKKGVGSGVSFYTKGGGARSDKPIATLINGKIDGHYHQKVNVIGGGENCFWAKEHEEEKVRLEYLNAQGKPTGIEAKIISRDEFMHTFFLCEEHGCSILKRLGEWPPK